jgi:hypothetical protein
MATVLTESFLKELRQKHAVETPCFSWTEPNSSELNSNEPDSDFRQNATEIGMLSNVSFER